MKVLVLIGIAAAMAHNGFNTRTILVKQDTAVDYCKKIDTLVNERYQSRKTSGVDLPKIQRILSELYNASGISGTYSLGYTGMTYCDTFFNNDIRRWEIFFNCKKRNLRPAPKVIPAPCDTTKFVIDE